jgi:hypothetical protein
MNTRTGVRGRPAFCDPEKSFIKREGRLNIANCERDVVDAQAANNRGGGRGGTLRQSALWQDQYGQRLDKTPSRHSAAFILIE